MKHRYWMGLACCALVVSAGENAKVGTFAPLFPFVISYDAPTNVVNLSGLLEAPAGKHGNVRVKNGHFATDAGRIRFHATNLTGPANFPTHAEADRLAARLARFGINCVRLHYFDAEYGNFMEPKEPGIIAADFLTKRRLDPLQRDKQDYLIAALKKRGIYVNINLHIARDLDARDGVAAGTPWANKGVDAFDPWIIQLEKEYARDLLTHVNPYTGFAYTNEPSVAMVELNNEDSVFSQYFWGGFNNLREPYATELRTRWNAWLLRKYQTDEAVRSAYRLADCTSGPEQIAGASDAGRWLLDLGKAKAELTATNGTARLTVKASGDHLFPKVYRPVRVQKGIPYTLSFRIRRADGSKELAELGLAVATRRKGWTGLGLLTSAVIGEKWKLLTYSFMAEETDDRAEIQWTRFPTGAFQIEGLSFRKGGVPQLPGTASLTNGTFPILTNSGFAPFQMKRDFYEFLADTERAYWTGMRRFLIEELHLAAPVTGTQLGYTPPHLMAELDYVDDHEYWNHPGPISPAWEIRTSAMVNHGLACVRSMACCRVAGKPYTVSEYNHPYPEPYGAEGQPMLRAYGAFQGWDGVFEYTYNHRAKAEPDHNTYFFSIVARTDVLAHMPACAAMFLRGDVKEGAEALTATLPYERYLNTLARTRNLRQGITEAGYAANDALKHRVQVDVAAKEMISNTVHAATEELALTNDTRELVWNHELPNAGYWLVNTPNTKLFTGFPRGREIALGNVRLAFGATRMGWATVSLTSHDATGFGTDGKPARILLAATGVSQNNGAVFTEENGKRYSRGEGWGKGPVMNEGIPARITLPSPATATRCFALDETGARRESVPVQSAGRGCAIAIGPQYQTVWYEIEVKDAGLN